MQINEGGERERGRLSLVTSWEWQQWGSIGASSLGGLTSAAGDDDKGDEDDNCLPCFPLALYNFHQDPLIDYFWL